MLSINRRDESVWTILIEMSSKLCLFSGPGQVNMTYIEIVHYFATNYVTNKN